MPSGLVRVASPDELAAVLLRDRLPPLLRCEIVRVLGGSWEVQVLASGPATVAAVLASTREWLEAERIAATTVSVDGETHLLERLA